MAVRSTPISVLTLQPKTEFSQKNGAPYNQETMVMTLSLLEVINVGLSNFSLQYQHNIKQVWAVRGIRRRTKVCMFKTLVLLVLICGCETRKITKANERELNSFQCQCLRQILRKVELVRTHTQERGCEQLFYGISCEMPRRRWNWSGHILRREGVNNCFTAVGWTAEG